MIGIQEIGGVTALTTPLCVVTGLTVCVGVAVRAWRGERKRRAAYALTCPDCGAHIVSPDPFVDDSARAALVVATGHCPECGAQIAID